MIYLTIYQINYDFFIDWSILLIFVWDYMLASSIRKCLKILSVLCPRYLLDLLS